MELNICLNIESIQSMTSGNQVQAKDEAKFVVLDNHKVE